ncbi:MAG: mandelate racemase/muconate lactonizing enzyme family protein [Gammaproteobacteria bacterium]|nr:mandelate racemase/muconate lactonizing enzyme family protein [Gammaproteobacteria bacterium]
MKITNASVTLLRLPYLDPPRFQADYARDRDILVLEVETEDGHVGLGYQLFLWDGFVTTRACLEEIFLPRLIGRDAMEVEAIWQDNWQAAYADGRGGFALLALSAIDVALWDLIGQAAGLPLYKLWGQHRQQVPCYGSGCWRGLGGDGMVAKAERLVAAGYSAIKMQAGHVFSAAEDVANLKAMRETLGPAVDIMIDANMAWSADEALIIGHRLEAFDPYWIEEPVAAHDFDGYFRLADALTRTRIVGGENHFTRFELRPFFRRPGIPILQPDVARGGLTELRKIAIVANTFGMSMAPHLYPELMVHLLCSIPNGLVLEDMQLLDDIWIDPPRVEAGMLSPPHRPGHGLRIRHELMRDARYEP